MTACCLGLHRWNIYTVHDSRVRRCTACGRAVSLTPEEQFRIDTARALGRIEQRGIRNEAQLTALNATVSVDGQRISRLESILGTLKFVLLGAIGLVGAGVAALVAFVKGD